jgi:hypothetical protein
MTMKLSGWNCQAWGKAGYIANQWRTVARGTYSSGRLYDKVGEVSFAEVKFSLGNTVICQVLEGGRAGSSAPLPGTKV